MLTIGEGTGLNISTVPPISSLLGKTTNTFRAAWPGPALSFFLSFRASNLSFLRETGIAPSFREKKSTLPLPEQSVCSLSSHCETTIDTFLAKLCKVTQTKPPNYNNMNIQNSMHFLKAEENGRTKHKSIRHTLSLVQCQIYI